MQPRINPYKTAPDLMSALMKLENTVRDSGLEKSLAELVKTRASQINGCTFCLHMHTRDARAAGETEERLYLLDAWRESSLYTPRERAALAWTEAVTLVAQTHVPDSAFDDVSAQFDQAELVKADPPDHYDQRLESDRNRLPNSSSVERVCQQDDGGLKWGLRRHARHSLFTVGPASVC